MVIVPYRAVVLRIEHRLSVQNSAGHAMLCWLYDCCGLGGVGIVLVFPLAGPGLSAKGGLGLTLGLSGLRSLTWYASVRVPREVSSQNTETSSLALSSHT